MVIVCPERLEGILGDHMKGFEPRLDTTTLLVVRGEGVNPIVGGPTGMLADKLRSLAAEPGADGLGTKDGQEELWVQ